MSRHDGTAKPDLGLLADWLEGRLDVATAAHVAATVEQGDRELKESTEWVRDFVAKADLDRLPAPPPLIQQRLRQSYRNWSEGRDDRSPVAASAVLAFDSRVDRATWAVRGVADRNTVHLAYHAELAELVLDIRMFDRGRAQVDGQVFPIVPTDAPVFEVIATSPEAVVRVVDGDRLGRFHIPSIPLHHYDLVVTNGEFTMTAPLDLAAR